MNHRSILVTPPAALVLLFFVLFSTNVRMAAAQAEQELGLRLVGTAVAYEKDRSFAIMEVPATGGQRAFQEGDRWGDLLIRKIEPGYVVITTGRGDMILSLGPARGPRAAQSLPRQFARRRVVITKSPRRDLSAAG